MKLYQYQENAINAILNDSSSSQLISMPTGTGKTITFLSTAKVIGKRCLILVHREELLNQTIEKAKMVGFSEEEMSIVSSNSKEKMKKLTIAMVQTLSRNLDRFPPDSIEMVIIDEAHHAKANSYMEILKHFKVIEDKKLLLGFTATPLRGDGKSLGDLFLSHSFKMTLSEATQNGYICPVDGIRIEIKKSLEDIDTQQGDYDIKQLDKVMNCESINKLIANRCENLTKKPCIVFCTSVDHAKNIAKLLRKKGKKAISISYENSKKGTHRIITLLKEKRLDFITNAVKLSEGFDHPSIECVIMARPTRSPVLYKQMIGRGLRKSPGKIDCLVMEFSGNDPKMMRWEDIDENCTFQSCTVEQEKSKDEAIKLYRNRFNNPNVIILDVRISPFKFYECRIVRLVSFRKEFRFIPNDLGFCVFQFRACDPIKIKGKASDVRGHTNYGYMCFWKEKYKSFYIWSGGKLWDSHSGWGFKELEKQCMHFVKNQPGHMGKWYPSEEEKMNKTQMSLLKNPEKMSARKAEMVIEDCAIKQAIKLFWIDEEMPEEIDPENDKTIKSNSYTKIYELSGVY